MLEDLLEYHEKPEESAFVTEVMQRVEQQQRTRRMILTATGVVGATFGTIGAFLLSEPIARTIGEVQLLPVSAAVIAGLALLPGYSRTKCQQAAEYP